MEDWVSDTQEHLASHKRHTPGEFAWQGLEESVGTFSDLVQMMRRVEMRRAQQLQEVLSTLSKDMEKIDASLSQFGPAVANRPRMTLKLKFMHSNSPEIEVGSPAERRKMDTPALEESSSSDDTDASSWS